MNPHHSCGWRRATVSLCVLAMLGAAPLESARAGVVGTERARAMMERQHTLSRVELALARDEVRSALQAHGVDATVVEGRLAMLTDAELALLAERFDELPAGGSVVGIVGAVFIVLIVLELVGVTDIFKAF